MNLWLGFTLPWNRRNLGHQLKYSELMWTISKLMTFASCSSLGHNYTILLLSSICLPDCRSPFLLNLNRSVSLDLIFSIFGSGSNGSLLFNSSDSHTCTKDVEETKRSDLSHWRVVRGRIREADTKYLQLISEQWGKYRKVCVCEFWDSVFQVNMSSSESDFF